MLEFSLDEGVAGGPAVRVPTSAASNRHVYIVDDDSMVRRSLSFLLSTAGFQTRAFGSARDFLDDIDALLPGCVLLDIRMPDIDGLAALEFVSGKTDRFGIIAMTGHGDVNTAVGAMKRGAQDFLEKPIPGTALMEAIESVFAGLAHYCGTDADTGPEQARARLALLTKREGDVMKRLVAGFANKNIAHDLGISVRTVEMHRANLMHRMGATSIADAVRVAVLASV